MDSSSEGRKYELVAPISIGSAVNGRVPIINKAVKIPQANKRFITTQATKTNNRFQSDLDIKAPFSKAEGFVTSSPSIRTKPPSGKALRVNSVPFLSVKTFLIFGGIPKPNSRTRIPVRRAVIKCHHS